MIDLAAVYSREIDEKALTLCQLPMFSPVSRPDWWIQFQLRQSPSSSCSGIAFALPDSMRWVYSEIFKLNLPTFNGDDSWTLPMPSRFIVDQDAVIRAAGVNLDHTVRPEPQTAIEVLRGLKR